MIKGGDQPDVAGQQHAVAEDITGHVPDADHGEVLVLHVDPEPRKCRRTDTHAPRAVIPITLWS